MSRERGVWARWQETTQLVNSRGPWAEKKSRTSRLQESTRLGGEKCPGGRQRKVGKGENLQHLNVDFCSYVIITIYLALQIRSTHHAPRPWHFESKQNKDKNPFSPLEGGNGMKIRDYDPPPNSPSPMNIPPLHLYFPHKWLSKKPRAEATHLSAGFPSKSVFLLK